MAIAALLSNGSAILLDNLYRQRRTEQHVQSCLKQYSIRYGLGQKANINTKVCSLRGTFAIWINNLKKRQCSIFGKTLLDNQYFHCLLKCTP